MGDEHPNLVVVFFRAGTYGLVVGLAVGAGVAVFLGLMERPVDWADVLVATVAGAVFGLLTGLIMALVVSVVGLKHSDSSAIRILVSLLVIFVVGGLAGLIGVNASQVAFTFGAPAAVAVWIVYPNVLAVKPTDTVPRLDRSK